MEVSMTAIQPRDQAATGSLTHQGLSSAEVQERIRRGETNAFEPRVGRSYWDIIRDNFFNLFNVSLTILLVFVFFFQDWATLFFAGFSVVTNTILGTLQEISAKRKLDRLATLAAREAHVWREGRLVTLPAKQLVKDDILALSPGDLLPVDGVVVASDSLEMDESQLTGESDPVYKDAADQVTSGSFCLAGAALVQATRVGRDSAINQLTSIAKAYKRILTPTQLRVAAFVELSIVLMFILGPMLMISAGLHDKTLFDIVRDLVVFITSLVPQGLVLVSTLSLTVGAILISRHKTLIQRVNAVESVSYASVLCFDKTGTLTRNELTVQEIIPLGADLPTTRRLLYEYVSSLASQNTTAHAISQYAHHQLSENNAMSVRRKVREIPFTSARKWGAIVYEDETLLLGAAERLLIHSSNGSGPRTLQTVDEYSERGMRVLAFARMNGEPDNTVLDGKLEPLALIVLSDQIRGDIQETLDAFRNLGVGLKIISGDNVKTVKAIAEQAGMTVDRAYTGEQVDALSDSELDGIVRDAQLFARISPDGKRRVINALQRQGEYVAMVGDGVNDVPALKAANLAVVMNNGAQIAKDVADIILLNNAMTTLPLAFAKGKEITQTVYGTTKLFLSKNAYATLLFVLVGMMTLPFPITPVQISWVTFTTANIHGGLYGFGLLKPAPMERFRRDVLDYVIVSGFLGAVHMAFLYFVVYQLAGLGWDAARSALTCFALLYGLLIFWNTQGIELLRPRTLWQHKWSTLLAGTFALFGMLALYALPGIFTFVRPTLHTVLLITALFLLNVLLVEILMRSRRQINMLWKVVEP